MEVEEASGVSAIEGHGAAASAAGNAKEAFRGAGYNFTATEIPANSDFLSFRNKSGSKGSKVDLAIALSDPLPEQPELQLLSVHFNERNRGGASFNEQSAAHAVVPVSCGDATQGAVVSIGWMSNSSISHSNTRTRGPEHSASTSILFGLLCCIVNTILYLISGHISRLLQQEHLLQRHEALRTNIPICTGEEESAAENSASPSSTSNSAALSFPSVFSEQHRQHNKLHSQQRKQQQQHQRGRYHQVSGNHQPQAQTTEQQQTLQNQRQNKALVPRTFFALLKLVDSRKSIGARSAAGRYEQKEREKAAIPAVACIPAATAASTNNKTKAVSLQIPFFFSWLAQSFQTAFLFCGIVAISARSRRQQQQGISEKQQQQPASEGNFPRLTVDRPGGKQLQKELFHSTQTQKPKKQYSENDLLHRPLLEQWEGTVLESDSASFASSSFSEYKSPLCSLQQCDTRSLSSAAATTSSLVAVPRTTAKRAETVKPRTSPDAILHLAVVDVASAKGTKGEDTLGTTAASAAGDVASTRDAGTSERRENGSFLAGAIAMNPQISEARDSKDAAASAIAKTPPIGFCCSFLGPAARQSAGISAGKQSRVEIVSSSSSLHPEKKEQHWPHQIQSDQAESCVRNSRAVTRSSTETSILFLIQWFVEEELGYVSLQHLCHACFLLCLLSLLQAWTWTLAIGKDGMSVGSVTAIFNINPLFVLLLSTLVSADGGSAVVVGHGKEDTRMPHEQWQPASLSSQQKATQCDHRQYPQALKERQVLPPLPGLTDQKPHKYLRPQLDEGNYQQEKLQRRKSEPPQQQETKCQHLVFEKDQQEQQAKDEEELARPGEVQQHQNSKRFSDTLQQLIAVGLGLIGVALIAYHNEGERRSAGGVALVVLAAAASAVYEVLFKNWVLGGRSNQPLAFVFLTVGVMGCMTLCCLWGPVLLLHATGLEPFPAQLPPLPLMLLLVFVCCCEALHSLLLQLSLLLLPSPLLVALCSLLSLPAAAGSDWLAGTGGGVDGSGAGLMAMALLLAAVQEWGGTDECGSSSSASITRSSISRGYRTKIRMRSNGKGDANATVEMQKQQVERGRLCITSNLVGAVKQYPPSEDNRRSRGSSGKSENECTQEVEEEKRCLTTATQTEQGPPARNETKKCTKSNEVPYATATAHAGYSAESAAESP